MATIGYHASHEQFAPSELLGFVRSAERAGFRAEALMRAMAAYASEPGMLPEQVWDAPDIPDRGLDFGRPTGSVMPLLWAHSEYLKLRRSLKEGRVFDRPPQAVARYLTGAKRDAHALWRVEHPCRALPAGTPLRLKAIDGVDVRWKARGAKPRPTPDEKTFLGIRVLDFPAESLPKGAELHLTVSVPGGGGRRHEEEHSLKIIS